MEAVENTFHSVLPELKESLPVFQEIIKALGASLQDPKTKQGLKEFATDLLELAPLALEIAESFGTLLRVIMFFGELGYMILSPFIALGEGIVKIFNALFGDGNLIEAPVYAIQMMTQRMPIVGGMLSGAQGAVFEELLGVEQLDTNTRGSGAARAVMESMGIGGSAQANAAAANAAAAGAAQNGANSNANLAEEMRKINETLQAKEMSVNVRATSDTTVNVEKATRR